MTRQTNHNGSDPLSATGGITMTTTTPLYLRRHHATLYHVLTAPEPVTDDQGTTWEVECGARIPPAENVVAVDTLTEPAEGCRGCLGRIEHRELVTDGTQELLDAVDELAAAMKRKILKNRHKSGLGECDYGYLYDRIGEEAGELWDAWVGDAAASDQLRDEAADVANFAMFFWVKARREADESSGRGGHVVDSPRREGRDKEGEAQS